MVMIGTVLGLVAALGAAQLVQGLLYNVEALDPIAFTTVPLLLIGVAALAVYLPARKAASVEPIAKLALGIEVPEVLDEPIPAEDLATYEGVYELRPGFEVTVSSRGGQLFAQASGPGQREFRPKAQGDHAFVASFDDNVRVEFVVEGGTATTLILFQGGRRPRGCGKRKSPVILDLLKLLLARSCLAQGGELRDARHRIGSLSGKDP